MIFTHAIPLRANPEGGVVSAGQATISANATTVHIDQQSDRAVIDWRGFDIAPSERTEFQQPSGASIALNRVNSSSASHIDGQLSANGNIVIVNQNGVVFGRGAQVDVNSLIATTSDIRNEQFMAGGKLVFDQPGNNPNAQIINEGTITAKDAGLVGLVAPIVENRGVITARLGRVHLASGDTATVDFYGDGLLEVAISDNVTKQLVRNTGAINANGGLIALTAAAGKNIVDSLVTSTGSIIAKAVSPQHVGKVLIAGNNVSDVIIDGLIDASGLAASQTGGAVHIIGNRIALMNNTHVDVSGNAGAGEILVGGDYHGGAYRGMLDAPASAIEWGNTPGGYSSINRSPTAAFFAAYYAGMSPSGAVPTASRVFIDKDVMMVASSDAGNAGRIITWSNNGTAFYGHADVSANGIGGNGGFIEISGKDWLNFNGTINAHATNGANGMLLLDPADITISVAADTNISASTPFQSTGASSSNLSVATLVAALAGSNVTITSAAGTGGLGNITFTDAVAWNSAQSLTVTASNNIIVNNAITNAGSGSIALNASVASTGSISINDNVATGGSISASALGDITLAAGKTLTTGSAGSMNLQAAGGVIGGTGNLTISGNLAVGSGGLTLVSGINGTRPNYTANSTTLVQNAATLGAISILGFQDISIARAITSNSTITINPQRDITLTAAGSLTSTGAGSLISILAQRDITTIAGSGITTNATGSVNLQAANGSTAGTGNLTLNGNLSLGTGTLTLLSGINGTRPSLTLNATTFTQQGAAIGNISISGLQDVTISRAITASGTVAIAPMQDFIIGATGNLTSSNAGYALAITAQRDVTITSGGVIATTAGGSLTLQAANGSIAGTGNLNLNGSISVGTGALTLLSGINGTRPNLTLSSSTLTPLGAAIGNISITGFQDVTLSRAIIASGTISIVPTRDFIIGATGNLTSSSSGYSVAITAQRDLTISSGGVIATTATGSLSLQAANGVIGGTGNLTISGNISVGSGTLTLVSGINGTRPSLTINNTTYTQLGATVGVINITGLLDVTISKAVTSSGAITISPQQDFIVATTGNLSSTGAASVITILAQRDITINTSGVITTGANGSLSLQAANGSTAGTGNLTLNGNLSVGTGSLTLLSGINGTRPSLTLSATTLTPLGATIGATSITGFNDFILSRALSVSGALTINTVRDLTLSAALSTANTMAITPGRDFIIGATGSLTSTNAGYVTAITAARDLTITAGGTIASTATGGLNLQAAGGSTAGTGNMNLNGSISVGTGALTLLSGINGTRPNLVLSSATYTQLGATVGALTFSGFLDVTLSTAIASSAAMTIAPLRDFFASGSSAITSTAAITVNPTRDFITSGTVTMTAGTNFAVLAQRDITIGAGTTVSSSATGSMTLQAANNAIAGTGNLTVTGNISVGTGALTLVSGINGTRPSLTLNTTTLTPLGATIGAISITGMLDVTVARNITSSGAITISPQQSFTINNSATLATNGASAITILALKDITTVAGSTISAGTTGSIALQAANNAIAGTGNLTIGGILAVGSGALTLVSGINGTRPSLTLDNTTYSQNGATVGTVSITGMLDVTVSKNITGSGAITISPQQSFTLNNSATITTTGASAITIVALKDVTTVAGSTLSGGASGSLVVEAANNVVAGTGNLTLGGLISMGTGALTLTSGINGTRPSWVIDNTTYTQTAATIGVVTINGFQDVTVSKAMTGSGTITINPQRDFILSASQTITVGGAGVFTVLAQRDITTNASSVITTGATGGISLRAANASTAGTGNLNLGGNLSIGTGALTLLSGVNGTRPSATINSTFLTLLGATVGAISITGYQDVTQAMNIAGSGTITISPQRDFILNSGFTLSTNSASAITILAQRDIATAATSVISAGTTGSISLAAANNAVGGTGNLNLSGNLAVGTGTFTLLSGINGTRPSWTMDATSYTQNSATVGVVSISGFQDVTVSKAVTGSGNITINPQRDFILSASQTITVGGAGIFTVLAQRDITTNALSNITTGTTGGVSLRAANAAIAGVGNLNLSGKINIGTGALTLVTGANGTRPSLTVDATTFSLVGATVGALSITGYQDVTVATSVLTGNAGITIQTQRDLTLNGSQTITTGAAGALILTAANNAVAGVGNLTLTGNLSVGTGGLTLLSGANGTRPSYTMTSSNFTQQGANLGVISIQGFQDLNIDRDLTGGGNITILASRDLTLSATRTITGSAAGSITMGAANNVVAGTGNFYMNGIISAGTGALSLTSGINGTRPDLTISSTNLIRQGATFGAITIQGFNNLVITRVLNSTGAVNVSNNTSSGIAGDITSTGAISFSNAIVIAEGATVNITSTNNNITFSSTINGTAGGVAENLNISAGTGTVTFSGIVGGTAPLGNLNVSADNVTVSANLIGTGTLTFTPTATRAINIGTALADTATTAGLNFSVAEVGRIVNGWGSIVFGNTSAGTLTNSTAAWNDPVSFITGVDFASTVALTSADPIFVQAVRDVLLTQNITTTNTSANAIVLVAGRNFLNTASTNPLSTGAGGRWLVYSTDPTGTTGEQTMSNAFNRYSCTYGGSCPTVPGTGNGLLYSYTPLLDVTISPQTYNYGDAVIAPTGYTLQTSGYLNALDTSQGSVGGVGNFATSYVQGNNAGTGFTITNNGSTFTSNLGYGFNYISPTGLTVGTRAITIQVSDQTKVYGNALTGNAYTLASGSFYSTDAANLNFTTNASLSSSGNYNYRATPWTLSANGTTFTSGLASNYSVSYIAAPTGLTITQRTLAINATGTNRVYDGTATDTVTLGDNRVSGDVLTTSYTTATFADKNVGTAKTVSVSGINLTNTDSGNYTFNTTTSTSANITQRALTITAAGIDKIYDGLTTGTATLSDNRVAGDVFTTSYTGNYADKNVGTGKTLSITGIGITTGDAGNYTFNTTASTFANITQRALTLTATGVTKVYNGLTAAGVTFGDNRVAGDVFTVNYTGNFADKNVGTAKTISVTGINLTGTDNGNYSYATTASTSANITQRALTITATGIGKTYDGLTTATATLADNRVTGDVFTTTYTGNFSDKNVGTGKTINLTGINISTGDAANYSFNTTASTTANITQRALTITAAGIDKIYDGLTTATATLSDNRVAGDVFTTTYTGAYGNKNVGVGKAISITGINITTGDAANYSFNTTASTSATISQRALTITTTGIDKVYDGLTTAGITLGDNRVAGDTFTTTYGASNFSDKNVGVGKSIGVTGLNITSGDAANYTFNTTASASATITQRALAIAVTGTNKTYDGLTTAGITLNDNRVAGDTFTTTYGTANFSDKNVGTAKAISVTGLNVTSGDAANYSFNTTASTSANITQRALTITASGINKTYDGLTTAGVTFNDNRVAGDTFTTGYGASNFADKNAGTGKSISVTGLNITSGDAGNYSINTTTSTTADIAQRALMVTAAGIAKIYDGLTTATATLSDNRVAGDTFTTSYTGNFSDKNAGTGKAVSITGIGITSGDAANYTFNTTASTTANITQRALTVSAAGIDKVYDGLTTATATLTDNRVAGDTFTTSYTGNFANKNAGTAKTVSITGIGITSGDAANYTFNTTASTSANITQRALTITATGADKVYNGLTTANVSFSDNRVAGDTFTTSYGAANFGDKNVGVAKAIGVTGLNITTGDAANYTFNTTASTAANITQRALTITATGIGKTYDGLTTAGITLGDNRVAGDTFTTSYGAASFADKNAGVAKAISVTGLNIATGDAANYSFNTTASTSATIAQRSLTIAAAGADKVYDGLTTAGVTFTDNRVAGDVFNTSYSTADFANKNVGTGKAISVAGLNIATGDAANYTFNTTASTAANITQRALLITATGADKIYDGLTTAGVSFTDNRAAGDAFTTSYGSAIFGDKNVGTAKAISVTGLNIAAGDAGNYSFNTTASTAANITQRALTISAAGINKVYDGLTTATATLTDNRVAGDVFTTSYTGNFSDKNAGTGKAISITAIGITSGDAGNYSFNTTASTVADISQRALAINVTGTNKVYDGLTTAGIALGDNRVAGDTFTTTYAASNFADKNVGTGKAISVTGLNIASGDAANYTFNTTASTSADISQRALTIAATGVNKVYDGSATAPVTITDNRVAGDVFTTNYTAAFADKNAGLGKVINVTGIGITTGDAGNYSFNATASTSADITQRALTIAAVGVNKVYDGTATAPVTITDNRVTGDTFTTTYTATYADKNAANSKAINVTGINIATGDAANYTFNTATSTSADISQRALTLTATGINKAYDGSATAPVTITDNRVSGDVFNTSYASSTYADKNAGTNKAISVTGLNIATGDAGNYAYNTTASTSANVSQRALTIAATGADKTYDGLTTAGVSFTDNRVAGDVFTTSYGAANFADKNAGIGKAISVTGLNIATGDAANYSFNTTAATTATINQRALTIAATGVNKVYDGSVIAGVNITDNRVAGDVFTTNYTAAFADKNAGTAKAISLTGIGIAMGDAANYTYNTTASASGNITQRALTIAATGVDKVYDGSTSAPVTITDNRVAGDVFNTTYTSATYANKNVGTAKAISVAGLNITTGDAANYTFNTSASTSANVTQRALTISATASGKVYDGLTTASGVSLTDNRVAGDVFNTSFSAANFADKNAGTGKTINITGVNIATGDAGNYSFSTATTATANISQRALTITTAGANKVYDGTNTATVTFSDNRVAGDVLGYNYTASFADKNVGTAKAVNVLGIGLVGTDSGNYTANSTSTASANITPRALLISATSINKLYDGNTGAIITLHDNRISGDVLALSYGSANYADSSVGAAKPITVAGIGLTGIDSGNYNFNTTASAFSDIVIAPAVIVIAPIAPIAPLSLAVQLPNTVRKSVQTPIALPEFLLFDDEWQKRHHKLPTVGMLR